MRVFEASCCICLWDAVLLEIEPKPCVENDDIEIVLEVEVMCRGCWGGVVEMNHEQPHKCEAGGTFQRDVINVCVSARFFKPF